MSIDQDRIPYEEVDRDLPAIGWDGVSKSNDEQAASCDERHVMSSGFSWLNKGSKARRTAWTYFRDHDQ